MKIAIPALVALSILTNQFDSASGFLLQPATTYNNPQPLLLHLTKDENVLVSNTTKDDFPPTAQQVMLKIQTRCEEMKERNAKGETLTRKY